MPGQQSCVLFTVLVTYSLITCTYTKIFFKIKLWLLIEDKVCGSSNVSAIKIQYLAGVELRIFIGGEAGLCENGLGQSREPFLCDSCSCGTFFLPRPLPPKKNKISSSSILTEKLFRRKLLQIFTLAYSQPTNFIQIGKY